MKDFFLEANPNPERIGCPEERTLRALAEGRLPASHPARLHLASCSECFAEFRGFKGECEQTRKGRRRIIGWALAASLIVASGVGLWEYLHARAVRPRESDCAWMTDKQEGTRLGKGGRQSARYPVVERIGLSFHRQLSLAASRDAVARTTINPREVNDEQARSERRNRFCRRESANP